MPNPYLAVHARIRARRPKGASGVLLPLVAALLAAPLARPVLLGFLDHGPVPAGLEAVSFRLGALVVGVMSIQTYGALVRGPDRAVLDPHPVQPRLLLEAVAVQAARGWLWLPATAALLLLPMGLAGQWAALALGVAVVAGAYVAGLGLGFAGALGGVWAAYSPGLAAALDFLRGANPRMQAALIYAPGVVLAAGGGAVALAAAGARAALEGYESGLLFLLVPPLVGGVGWALALPLAQRWYVRATALLAEIDGAWAAVEGEAQERGHVYLGWVARDRVELARALRQGWRRLRSWATGAWLLGLGAALAGWTGSPDAADRVLVVGAGAALLIAALPVRLAEGDPEWLDLALGVDARRVGVARAVAAWLYVQGAILLPALALAVRHGLVPAALTLLPLEAVGALGAALAALAAARQRQRAAWLYGPAAVLIWAVTVNTLSGRVVAG